MAGKHDPGDEGDRVGTSGAHGQQLHILLAATLIPTVGHTPDNTIPALLC